MRAREPDAAGTVVRNGARLAYELFGEGEDEASEQRALDPADAADDQGREALDGERQAHQPVRRGDRGNEKPGNTRGCQHVAEVGLGGADRQALARREDARQRSHLDGVPDRCAGGVTLHKGHCLRRDTRDLVRLPHRPLLPVLRGYEQSTGASVVGQPDTAHHTEDRPDRPKWGREIFAVQIDHRGAFA